MLYHNVIFSSTTHNPILSLYIPERALVIKGLKTVRERLLLSC